MFLAEGFRVRRMTNSPPQRAGPNYSSIKLSTRTKDSSRLSPHISTVSLSPAPRDTLLDYIRKTHAIPTECVIACKSRSNDTYQSIRDLIYNYITSRVQFASKRVSVFSFCCQLWLETPNAPWRTYIRMYLGYEEEGEVS